MYCPKCGADIRDDNAAFCAKCGTSLEGRPGGAANATAVSAPTPNEAARAAGSGAAASDAGTPTPGVMAANDAGTPTSGVMAASDAGSPTPGAAVNSAVAASAPKSPAKRGNGLIAGMFAAAVVVIAVSVAALFLIPGSPLYGVFGGSSSQDDTVSMSQAFLDQISKLEEEHGEPGITPNKWDKSGNLHDAMGLCAAMLLDFTGDGVDDLMTVYRTEDELTKDEYGESPAYMINVYEYDPLAESGVREIFGNSAMSSKNDTGANANIGQYNGIPCFSYCEGDFRNGTRKVFAFKDGIIQHVATYHIGKDGISKDGGEPSEEAAEEERSLSEVYHRFALVGQRNAIEDTERSVSEVRSELEKGDSSGGEAGDVVESSENRPTSKELFAAKIAELQAKYGEAVLKAGVSGSNSSGSSKFNIENHLEGVFYADLMDFESDGEAELLVGYYNPNGTVDRDTIVDFQADFVFDPSFVFEIWRYNGEEIEKTVSFHPYHKSGITASLLACLGEYKGRPAFDIDGGGRVATDLRIFGIENGKPVELLALQQEMGGNYSIDGKSVSSEEFDSADKEAFKDMELVYTQYLRESDFDSYKKKVEETLKALEQHQADNA